MATQRVTIADIARRAEVSTSAVSYALNDLPGVSAETRRRIVSIADSMGWRPNRSARALHSSRTDAVGLVLLNSQQPQTTTPDFLNSFLPGVQTELAEHDVLLVLHLVPDAQAATETYRSWHSSRRVDGAIVLNPTVADPRLPFLERLGMPAVVVGDSRRVSGLPCVWTDDGHAVDLAVQHLAGLGHRRIARVGLRSNYLHSRVRGRAFTRAMRQAGLATDLHGYPSAATTDAELLAGWLRQPEPPTAVIQEDPLSAVRTVRALMDSGVRVPADVSVLGWDDSPWSGAVTPTLTILRRDLYTYGRRVAAQLLKALDGETVGHLQGTETELVARESTGPLRR